MIGRFRRAEVRRTESKLDRFVLGQRHKKIPSRAQGLRKARNPDLESHVHTMFLPSNGGGTELRMRMTGYVTARFWCVTRLFLAEVKNGRVNDDVEDRLTIS